MSGCCAYVIGEDGHIQDRRNLQCLDDEDAKRRAKQLVDGHAIELWQEARKIATFVRKGDRHGSGDD
jgi:hypothetical protein